MREYRSYVVNDEGLIHFYTGLRNLVKIFPGDRVSLQHIDDYIILHRNPESPDADYHNIKICDNDESWYGGIEAPEELLKKLGWRRYEILTMHVIDDDAISINLDKYRYKYKYE